MCRTAICLISLLIAIANGTAGEQSGQRGQKQWAAARAVEGERMRLIYPSGYELDAESAQRIIAAFEAGSEVPGLPAAASRVGRATVSLATEFPESMDGRAFPREARIVLPLVRATVWPGLKLIRVAKHELAHLAVGAYLDHRDTPHWFREGFAEWAAGGLTCEGEARIRLALLSGPKDEPSPTLSSLGETPFSRVSYDFFATFFAYLDEVSGGGVASGAMLESVKELGVESGVGTTARLSLGVLEGTWRAEMGKRYGGSLDELECDPAVDGRRFGRGRLQLRSSAWLPSATRSPQYCERIASTRRGHKPLHAGLIGVHDPRSGAAHGDDPSVIPEQIYRILARIPPCTRSRRPVSSRSTGGGWTSGECTNSDSVLRGRPRTQYFEALADLLELTRAPVDLVRFEEVVDSLHERIEAEGEQL